MFYPLKKQRCFCNPQLSVPVVGPIQLLTYASLPLILQLGRASDQSLPSGADIYCALSCVSLSACLSGVMLNLSQGHFYFTVRKWVMWL